jgi:hypothetical protein
LARPSVHTYEEACQIVVELGILPLSSFMPGHPSLESITEPAAWHTSTDADPWLWRNRFAEEGLAAYGRLLGDKPQLVSRELFPLVRGVLAAPKTVEERYAAGLLARPALLVYDCIREHDGIDVRTLRMLTEMQRPSEKRTFDRALTELQNSADLVISGISARLNEHGHKSGWNSTCYMLADHWMERHGIEQGRFAPGEAKTTLYAWIEPWWEEAAVLYVKRKVDQRPN